MKLTLGEKLGLGFEVILSLMVFSATAAYLRAGKIQRSQDEALPEWRMKCESWPNTRPTPGRRLPG